jgi:hypothetical protein
MADPMTLALVGAGVGAALSPNDPIKGAILGGVGGFTGGSALAGAGATGTAAGAATAGAGAELYASTIPGLASAAPGSQAAALAAQTGEFGLAGLTATGASATNAAGTSALTRGAWDAANQMAMGGKTSEGLNALKMAQQMGGQQPQPTAVSPQQMKRGPVNLSEPIAGLLGGYGPMDIQRRRRMTLMGGQPSLLG